MKTPINQPTEPSTPNQTNQSKQIQGNHTSKPDTANKTKQIKEETTKARSNPGIKTKTEPTKLTIALPSRPCLPFSSAFFSRFLMRTVWPSTASPQKGQQTTAVGSTKAPAKLCTGFSASPMKPNSRTHLQAKTASRNLFGELPTSLYTSKSCFWDFCSFHFCHSADHLGMGQNKLTRIWTAGFSLWFHLSGFHFGYAFLTHCHLVLPL